ncbi:hypothetical protein AU467_22290 [Mesorhizobium loti]|uniref:Uncharacterized protein n=1 Tax=Rhizobium loti TaxID=381 RepID=A0A117N3D8_RHILI|nr:hypothetical protein AU467_22290 [Mesorhizobium loti]
MPDETRSKLRPTIVSPPARKASIPQVGPARPLQPDTAGSTPTVKQPTAIAGKPRERIPVTAGDLRKLSPGAAKDVIDRTLNLLGAFVVEKASERKAILWGHDLQKAYSDAIAETLALSQAPVVRKVQGYITRMLEILGSFDVMSALGKGGGGIGRYFKGINGKTDTVSELAAARTELDQIVRIMGEALGELLDLRDKLEKNARTVETIAVDAEAAALAALYLSEYFRPAGAALADRFLERSMSLTQTLLQIRGNSAIRDVQIEQPIRMIGSIQNVTLVSMPHFLSSLAAINSLALRDALVTPTEASELNYKLHDIIRQLKS